MDDPDKVVVATFEVIQVDKTSTPGARISTALPRADMCQYVYFLSIAPAVKAAATRPGLYAPALSPVLPAAMATGTFFFSADFTIASKPA